MNIDILVLHNTDAYVTSVERFRNVFIFHKIKFFFMKKKINVFRFVRNSFIRTETYRVDGAVFISFSDARKWSLSVVLINDLPPTCSGLIREVLDV